MEAPASPFHVKPFELEEATLEALQTAMTGRKETAVSLTRKYLRRIEELDHRGPALHAIIETNPDAIGIAESLDRERRVKKIRGPLHGIPILLKDNIDTHDRTTTTAGSLFLKGSIPQRDSFVAQKLREAGAVLLGKANLSEWANFRSEHSSSGWSARGGQTLNPYALDRNPSGSSSGSAVAVAANLCAIAIGTETDGSITSPASCCGIVGIKPTVGLVSRSGIIPIAHSQDTAGPMARTVTDAAILLTVLSGWDERDPATEPFRGEKPIDYTQFLDRNGLRGARLGVARTYFDSSAAGKKVWEAAVEEMKRQGAIVIDPADGAASESLNDTEFEVLLYEFKADLNTYFANLDARKRTLEDLIRFNEENQDREMPYFGQDILLKAQQKGPLTEPAYLEALEKCRRLSRREGIDATIAKHKLDAIIEPTGGPAGKTDHIHGNRGVGGNTTPPAVAGYPHITVPAGQISGLPVGVSFYGAARSEPTLIKLAYAFEQATKARKPPQFLQKS